MVRSYDTIKRDPKKPQPLTVLWSWAPPCWPPCACAPVSCSRATGRWLPYRHWAGSWTFESAGCCSGTPLLAGGPLPAPHHARSTDAIRLKKKSRWMPQIDRHESWTKNTRLLWIFSSSSSRFPAWTIIPPLKHCRKHGGSLPCCTCTWSAQRTHFPHSDPKKKCCTEIQKKSADRSLNKWQSWPSVVKHDKCFSAQQRGLIGHVNIIYGPMNQSQPSMNSARQQVSWPEKKRLNCCCGQHIPFFFNGPIG